MQASLRALLSGIIDYAGMFPPARLPLPEAIHNYAQYRNTPNAWMMSRFICPAGQLAELGEYGPKMFAEAAPLRVSALGRGGADATEFLAATAADVQAINDFEKDQGRRASVDVFEVRLPDEFFALANTGRRNLMQRAQEIFADNSGAIKLFFEITMNDNWRDWIDMLLDDLNALSGDNNDSQPGFKLRCGGLAPASFPSVEQVAFCLHGCLSRKVAFKATAGLHHPLRRYAADVQAMMHGFINVFGAGVLAQANRLSPEQIQPILAEQNPSHFQFTEDGFSFGQWRVAMQDIAAIREQLLISFGSCSFTEPQDDLHALGWL